MEEVSRRNRELFALPPYVLYVARAFSTLEGIGLSVDEDYAIVQEWLRSPPQVSVDAFKQRPRPNRARAGHAQCHVAHLSRLLPLSLSLSLTATRRTTAVAPPPTLSPPRSQECYPYLARRLFTDRSPRSKAALRAMLGLDGPAVRAPSALPFGADTVGVVVPTAQSSARGNGGGGGGGGGGGLSPSKLVEMSEQFREATAATATVDRGAGQAEATRELAGLLILEAEYVAMHSNQHSRGHGLRCIRPYSAVITVFVSLVFSRRSEYSAQGRTPALMLVY